MSFVTSFREGVAGLVHENARMHPHEFARHGDFIATRLVTALAPLALAPVYLAMRGRPDLWESLIFICSALPLASVVVLSRTGNFVVAQGLSIAGLLMASVILAFGLGGISAAALVWLVLVPIEAVFALSAPLVLASLVASCVTLAAIMALAAHGMMPRDGEASLLLHTFFVAPAIVHMGAMALGALRQLELRRKRERVGAARFSTLASAMGDLVLRHDRGGAVLYASDESEALFGLPPREFMGRGLFERVLVQDRPAFLKAIADAADGYDTVRCELRLRAGNTASARGDFDEPVFVWVEMRARRLAHRGADTEEHDGACVLAVLRDVNRFKLHEQQLQAARQEAEAASAWKDRFIANVSHELRTPLNAIIGFSELLGNDELAPTDPAKRKEYVGIIHSSGHHLLSVVNSILDISKIEAGRFDILTEPFEVAPLVAGCCDMMGLKAAEAGVEIIRACPETLDELVADKRACKQILINLLSNALKFTPKGGRVTVGARHEGNSIAIFVSDTGVGIAAADMRQLGDVFYQAGGDYNRRFEGTGLGLSVVRGLVGLHGGSISIESCPGDGTCVTVLLPRDGIIDAGKQRVAAPIETIARICPAPREQRFNIDEKVKKIA